MAADGLDIDGGGAAGPGRATRKAALGALERLLRAQAAMAGRRVSESPYGLLRPAREEELALAAAVFAHSGVPLPATLPAIWRRTLGVGNPVGALPVLSVPFLRAALPDEGTGLGPVRVGIEAFEHALALVRDGEDGERPPVLALGHAEVAGLTASRSGLWSLADYRGGRGAPEAGDFRLGFESAFVAHVETVLLVWANDLAGAVLRPREVLVLRDAPAGALPAPLRAAMAELMAPRATVRPREEVLPLDHGDLLRATRRGEAGQGAALQGQGIPVVGLPYGDWARAAATVGPGTVLRPVPVEDNPHDPMAVEVWLDAGTPALRLGFVARAAAPEVRALPGGADAWRLRVVEVGEHALLTVPERAPAGPGAGEEPGDLFAETGD